MMNLNYLFIIAVVILIYMFLGKTEKVKKELSCDITPLCKDFLFSWMKFRINNLYYFISLRNKLPDLQEKLTDLLNIRDKLLTTFSQIYGSQYQITYSNLLIQQFDINTNLINAKIDNKPDVFNYNKQLLIQNTKDIANMYAQLRTQVKKEEYESKMLKSTDLFIRITEVAGGVVGKDFIANTFETASLLL